jgi:hypothetical protein
MALKISGKGGSLRANMTILTLGNICRSTILKPLLQLRPIVGQTESFGTLTKETGLGISFFHV